MLELDLSPGLYFSRPLGPLRLNFKAQQVFYEIVFRQLKPETIVVPWVQQGRSAV
jgi:hypothetical protein